MRSITRSILGLVLLLLGASAASAADAVVTLTVTVTNAPTAGATLVINGATRTWSASITNPATQIQVTNHIGRSATNLYAQTASYPFAGPLALGFSSSNVVTFRGPINLAITASAAGSWASLALSTNSVTNAFTVRMPASVNALNVRRYIADELVRTIQDDATTNSFSTNAPALSNYVNRATAQTIAGAKTFTGPVVALNLTSSNGVNVGSAFSSPGSGGESEQFGALAKATNGASLAVGASALAGGASSTALGAYATANGQRSIVIGEGATDAGYSNTVVLGKGAAATGPWDIILGALNHIVRVPGRIIGPIITNAVYHGTIGLLSGGTISNTTVTASTVNATGGLLSGVTVSNAAVHATSGLLNGVTVSNGTVYATGGRLTSPAIVTPAITNPVVDAGTFTGASAFSGSVRWAMTANSSLANGVNAAVDPGPGAFLKITAGPSAAFTVNGISGGQAGRVLAVQNGTGQAMTWANDSGIDPTAANRILTFAGGDVTTSGNSLTFLIYDSAAARWILLGLGSVTNATGVASYNGATGAVTGPSLTGQNIFSGVTNKFTGDLLSPGAGFNSLKMGIGATAGGDYSVSYGESAIASGQQGTAIGEDTQATALSATAIGTVTRATGAQSTAIGGSADATAPSATALGANANAAHTNSTAVGRSAATTKTAQVRLGLSTDEVSVPGILSVEGGTDLLYAIPGTPAANYGRLYVAKNGTKFVLVVKWPDASTNAIAQQP